MKPLIAILFFITITFSCSKEPECFVCTTTVVGLNDCAFYEDVICNVPDINVAKSTIRDTCILRYNAPMKAIFTQCTAK